MQENKLFEMINLYLDGELKKTEESQFFSQLANSERGRNYFKQLSLIRNAADNSTEEFPEELEERILRSVGKKSSRKPKVFSSSSLFSVITYAAALILLFVSGYLYLKVSNYQNKVENLSQQVMMHTKTIQLLYNSLPGIEVHATLDNEIIIKPNI